MKTLSPAHFNANKLIALPKILLKVLFALAIVTPLCAENEINSKEKISVLLIDGQNNHDWKACSPTMINILEATERFKIERATVSKEEVASFSPKWNNYDAVLTNYNGLPWTEKTKSTFEAYIKEGGNLVVVHAADNSFPDWKEYNRMIGLGGWGGRNEKDGPYVYWKDGAFLRDDSPGKGGAHGKPLEYKVVVRDTNHPITKGLPVEFLQAKEELYDQLRGPAENMNVLATALATGGSERHEPVLMTITYGKGRIFHTVMGHDAKSMRGIAFQETLIRGTEWAATGEVTFPPVSSEELPVDRAASRHPDEIKPSK
ncbi:MAG: trehalose utilization [Verrucomicrobiales bacterium]|jgi:type 1 glutamine amidotransferase|nr:trehalose utilization [Verrucomicrobiales bacterium]|tara:strand:+ start:5951 stop:6898 length:948 start_codon:yes stop_codon:yes gene_type:complete